MERTLWPVIALVLIIVLILPTTAAVLALLGAIVILLYAIGIAVRDLDKPKD